MNAAEALFHRRINHEPSFWLRERVQQFLDAALAGSVIECGHVTQTKRPVTHALWAPAMVVCETCVPGRLKLTGDADKTCDRCGVVDAGGVRTGAVQAAVVAGQPLIVVFGLCDGCTAREGFPE